MKVECFCTLVVSFGTHPFIFETINLIFGCPADGVISFERYLKENHSDRNANDHIWILKNLKQYISRTRRDVLF